MTLKQRFAKHFEERPDGTRHLIVAVKLPTGAIELIHNTDLIETKVHYYLNAYDDEFRLKANPEVRIINFMIV